MGADEDNAAESTPLITRELSKRADQVTPIKYSKSVLYRTLLCGFMVSLSFGVTQVPLIYVFRLMTCEDYYKSNPEPVIEFGRCQNRQIEAGTARAVSLLSASTTVFGVLNLFVTGWIIKKFGIKSALLVSVFWPTVRLAVQNIGVMTGGGTGIIIIQSSQIITILGGPAGYLLALNSYIAEVVEPNERTGSLGKLQGCSFLGMSSAYLVGGLISDVFGIIAPFRLTLVLFLASSLYVLLFLPWIPLDKVVVTGPSSGFAKFFGPLKIFTPQKWMLRGGQVRTEYGTVFLGIGVFLGILATGYIPVLLQMYATDSYNFSATENGYMISMNTFIRGLFLMLVFPRIVSAGRVWLSNRNTLKDTDNCTPQSTTISDLPKMPNEYTAIEGIDNDEELVEPPNSNHEGETFEFDLLYTKYSLLADGILTGGASFVSQGWHMYLVAALLPFAAGTSSASKGTILQMCSASERADALSAITLVEMVARLATTTVFGLIYAAFAEIEMTRLVFICNASFALLGFFTLLFSRFPPAGSQRFVKDQAS